MLNYILTSTFIHTVIALSLLFSPELNTSSSDKIEVTLIQKPENAPILPSLAKPLKTGSGANTTKNNPKIDLKDYSDRIKAAIDPIFVAKMKQNNYHNLNVIILLFPNKYGRIISVVVKKSSGNLGYDKLAVDSIWEAQQIPEPPDELVKLGIEWSFST